MSGMFDCEVIGRYALSLREDERARGFAGKPLTKKSAPKGRRETAGDADRGMLLTFDA
jgi:hypothetical protein